MSSAKSSSKVSKKKSSLSSVEDFMIVSEPSNNAADMVPLGHATPRTGLGFRMQQQQSHLQSSVTAKPVAMTSLVEACRHTIVLKLERYPPEVLAHVLEEEEWNLLLRYRHEKTKPRAGSGGLDGTGRIAPCLEHKFMTAVEACSPRFRSSEVADVLVWKDCVNYTFRKGGLTRPKNLEWPWPLMMKRVQSAGDNLLNEKLSETDLPAMEESLHLLHNTPMNVNLLMATGIGKTLKKAIKKHTKKGLKTVAPMDALMTKWKALAEQEGVKVSSSSSSLKQKHSKSESDAEWKKDWELAERAHNWRQLFAVLNERESNRRSQQGQRMREIRGKLNHIRPKVVKVRPASSKSRFTQSAAPASTASNGNAKLAQLKREAQVTSSRQNRGHVTAPRPSGGGFSVAVARAAGSKAGTKRRMMGGQRSMSIPTKFARKGAKGTLPSFRK